MPAVSELQTKENMVFIAAMKLQVFFFMIIRSLPSTTQTNDKECFFFNVSFETHSELGLF